MPVTVEALQRARLVPRPASVIRSLGVPFPNLRIIGSRPSSGT